MMQSTVSMPPPPPPMPPPPPVPEDTVTYPRPSMARPSIDGMRLSITSASPTLSVPPNTIGRSRSSSSDMPRKRSLDGSVPAQKTSAEAPAAVTSPVMSSTSEPTPAAPRMPQVATVSTALQAAIATAAAAAPTVTEDAVPRQMLPPAYQPIKPGKKRDKGLKRMFGLA